MAVGVALADLFFEPSVLGEPSETMDLAESGKPTDHIAYSIIIETAYVRYM